MAESIMRKRDSAWASFHWCLIYPKEELILAVCDLIMNSVNSQKLNAKIIWSKNASQRCQREHDVEKMRFFSFVSLIFGCDELIAVPWSALSILLPERDEEIENKKGLYTSGRVLLVFSQYATTIMRQLQDEPKSFTTEI